MLLLRQEQIIDDFCREIFSNFDGGMFVRSKLARVNKDDSTFSIFVINKHSDGMSFNKVLCKMMYQSYKSIELPDIENISNDKIILSDAFIQDSVQCSIIKMNYDDAEVFIRSLMLNNAYVFANYNGKPLIQYYLDMYDIVREDLSRHIQMTKNIELFNFGSIFENLLVKNKRIRFIGSYIHDFYFNGICIVSEKYQVVSPTKVQKVSIQGYYPNRLHNFLIEFSKVFFY